MPGGWNARRTPGIVTAQDNQFQLIAGSEVLTPLDGFPCGPAGSYLGSTTGREEGALPCPAYAGSSSARAAHRAACGHCATRKNWPAPMMRP